MKWCFSNSTLCAVLDNKRINRRKYSETFFKETVFNSDPDQQRACHLAVMSALPEEVGAVFVYAVPSCVHYSSSVFFFAGYIIFLKEKGRILDKENEMVVFFEHCIVGCIRLVTE